MHKDHFSAIHKTLRSRSTRGDWQMILIARGHGLRKTADVMWRDSKGKWVILWSNERSEAQARCGGKLQKL